MSINKRRFFIIIGALIVIGAATGAVLYYAYPVQMDTIGGLTRNYILTLFAPPSTTTTEVNSAYKGAFACWAALAAFALPQSDPGLMRSG